MPLLTPSSAASAPFARAAAALAGGRSPSGARRYSFRSDYGTPYRPRNGSIPCAKYRAHTYRHGTMK
jgi:hypothetical protein